MPSYYKDTHPSDNPKKEKTEASDPGAFMEQSISTSSFAQAGVDSRYNSTNPEVKFQIGDRVEYWSQTYSLWMDATVQLVKKTQNRVSVSLDIKSNAQPERIRHCSVNNRPNGQNEEPPTSTGFYQNEVVEYWSNTHQGWMPAVVQGVGANDSGMVVNLDIKKNANPTKIRKRSSSEHRANGVRKSQTPTGIQGIQLQTHQDTQFRSQQQHQQQQHQKQRQQQDQQEQQQQSADEVKRYERRSSVPMRRHSPLHIFPPTTISPAARDAPNRLASFTFGTRPDVQDLSQVLGGGSLNTGCAGFVSTSGVGTLAVQSARDAVHSAREPGHQSAQYHPLRDSNFRDRAPLPTSSTAALPPRKPGVMSGSHTTIPTTTTSHHNNGPTVPTTSTTTTTASSESMSAKQSPVGTPPHVMRTPQLSSSVAVPAPSITTVPITAAAAASTKGATTGTTKGHPTHASSITTTGTAASMANSTTDPKSVVATRKVTTTTTTRRSDGPSNNHQQQVSNNTSVTSMINPKSGGGAGFGQTVAPVNHPHQTRRPAALSVSIPMNHSITLNSPTSQFSPHTMRNAPHTRSPISHDGTTPTFGSTTQSQHGSLPSSATNHNHNQHQQQQQQQQQQQIHRRTSLSSALEPQNGSQDNMVRVPSVTAVFCPNRTSPTCARSPHTTRSFTTTRSVQYMPGREATSSSPQQSTKGEGTSSFPSQQSSNTEKNAHGSTTTVPTTTTVHTMTNGTPGNGKNNGMNIRMIRSPTNNMPGSIQPLQTRTISRQAVSSTLLPSDDNGYRSNIKWNMPETKLNDHKWGEPPPELTGPRQGLIESRVSVGDFDPDSADNGTLFLKWLDKQHCTITKLEGFQGGLNRGIWEIKYPDGKLEILKLICADRLYPLMPTDAENIRRTAERFPYLLSDESVCYPFRMIRIVIVGNEEPAYDLFCMRKSLGSRLSEVLSVAWRINKVKVYDMVYDFGRFLASFHDRYCGTQHVDVQPSNIFYNEQDGHFTLIDMGGMGVKTTKTDIEHFTESLRLLSLSYGEELFDIGAKYFQDGYEHAAKGFDAAKGYFHAPKGYDHTVQVQ